MTDEVTDDDETLEIPARGKAGEIAAKMPSDRPRDVSASPSIRNLVARIEAAVVGDSVNCARNGYLAQISADDDNPDSAEAELSRELKEIESLRSELNGLRERIASGQQA